MTAFLRIAAPLVGSFLGAAMISSCSSNLSTMDEVERLERTDFGRDGRIHIMRRGAFATGANLQFCVNEGQFGIVPYDVEQFLRSNGIAAGREVAASEGRAPAMPECHRDGAIFTSIKVSGRDSRSGTAITLSAWQGKSIWVGKIARENEDVLSTPAQIADAGLFTADINRKMATTASVDRDIALLKKSFFSHLRRKP